MRMALLLQSNTLPSSSLPRYDQNGNVVLEFWSLFIESMIYQKHNKCTENKNDCSD
jgi:hypothetical protein